MTYFCAVDSLEQYQHISNIKCFLDPCDDHFCYNGGTCEVENEVTKCVCAAGFKGDTCQTGSVPLYLKV